MKNYNICVIIKLL